ncbi:MAG: hypothetical protein AAB957_00780 [Patescibacteria group bacterium]
MTEKFRPLEFGEPPKQENKPEEKPKIELVKEIIETPEGTYFIHGVKQWSKKDRIDIRSPEVSVSLQKDDFTEPLRPYGYILKIDKGAISGAFDRDVTSTYNERYEKELKPQSAGRKHRHYGESELQELMTNTKTGSHNEVWVKKDKTEIVGAYITEEALSAPGAKVFLQACQKDNIPVRIIKKESEIESE